ncbi:MAG: FdtA/QdtA family cupin domain-containing protein [Sulfuritalea sp.]|jgi:mannose-6-phosphate isomerase-like protein (cupin superfamily)|nr:FdtA/QdtA family cupin domain-containing protein [Sulfuritalea sp.]
MTGAFPRIELPHFRDLRGALTVMQDVLPFPVKRIFWITGADECLRGGHRHHRNRQFLVALQGRVAIHMENGFLEEDVLLDRPNIGLLVEPHDWHTMKFDAGAVLLVFASELYDRDDYIDTPYE